MANGKNHDRFREILLKVLREALIAIALLGAAVAAWTINDEQSTLARIVLSASSALSLDSMLRSRIPDVGPPEARPRQGTQRTAPDSRTEAR